jgi:hypothetical protein
MLAMDRNSSEDNLASPSVLATADCYFSHNLGVTFDDGNSVAQNPAVLDALASVSPNDITKEKGQTTFPVDTHGLGHFLHLVYCHTGNGMKLRVEFDGVFPFDAPDETGALKRFNAQLLTISEVAE